MSGIGGLFFKAHDPESLANWYRQHLGIDLVPQAYDQQPWTQAAGPTVFAPFKSDSDYFSQDKQWMLNLRVSGLDELLEKLRAAGIGITTKAEWDTPETGRFARIHDPEGNPIELWEPPVAS